MGRRTAADLATDPGSGPERAVHAARSEHPATTRLGRSRRQRRALDVRTDDAGGRGHGWRAQEHGV